MACCSKPTTEVKGTMTVRNIFDREKRLARRQRLVSLFAWTCFMAIALLALDNVGVAAVLF